MCYESAITVVVLVVVVVAVVDKLGNLNKTIENRVFHLIKRDASA